MGRWWEIQTPLGCRLFHNDIYSHYIHTYIHKYIHRYNVSLHAVYIQVADIMRRQLYIVYCIDTVYIHTYIHTHTHITNKQYTYIHTCLHIVHACIGVCGAQQLDGAPERAGVFEVHLAQLGDARSGDRSRRHRLPEGCMYVCMYVWYVCMYGTVGRSISMYVSMW